MTNARNTIGTLALAGLLGAGLAGCSTTHQFDGMVRYGNLMSPAGADDATAGAKAQLIATAESYGLELRYEGKHRLRFVAGAPTYTVTQPDGEVEERVDPREVHVEAKFDEHAGRNTYRYYCWVEGSEPVHFTDEDRARFGLALLAVREIFEKPIATDFLGE
jgi:hypothetical protein